MPSCCGATSSTLNNKPQNCPFNQKILEKVVHHQLSPFLNGNGIFDKLQSGFWAHLSTESALLEVSNNLLLTDDSEKCAILHHLDLSAAFSSIVREILLEHLRQWADIQRTVLEWSSSSLKGRTFSVELGNMSCIT